MLGCCLAFGDDRTGLLKNDEWLQHIRRDHPRLFLNRDMLPKIKAYAAAHPALLEDLRKQVEALPADAPYIELTDTFTRDPATGQVKPVKPGGGHGDRMLKYAGAVEAARCALYYTLTGDRSARDKAVAYLRLFHKALDFSRNGNWWLEHTGFTRINAMFAYDLLYNDLTPEERREIILPILEYVRDSQPNRGKFTFRRTHGSHRDGNYGETALEYFLGITLYGDGIADEEAEAMLKRGAALFVRMMDFRDEIAAGSGLLASLTYGYSFGAYPWATHLFLHSWKAAFGADIAERWNQMRNYHRFVAGMTFLPDGKGLVYVYGIGDMPHTTNRAVMDSGMFLHLAQNIHFYGAKHPDTAAEIYAFMAEAIPEKQRFVSGFNYPMFPFLLTGFEPSKVRPGVVSPLPYYWSPRFGFLSMWSGRGPNDTYASFRFGGDQINHQHYDDLSFTIFKYDFLALDAGSRTETDHHHNFGSQTVAHNSLLIHRPEEPMPPFWHSWSYKPDGKTYFNHGGQTRKDRGKPLAFYNGESCLYAAGDGAGNYGAEKCREAVRQFVYLKPDTFVIYDRVTTVSPDQRQEFLLHTTNEPEMLSPGLWRADAGKGRLFAQVLLPAGAHVEKVGGPGHEFWASGQNWPLEPNIQFRYAGNWRLEVSPAEPTDTVRFCHVLQAADTGTETPQAAAVRAEGEEDVVTVAGWELRFRRTGAVGLRLRRAGGRIFAFPNNLEKPAKKEKEK